MYAQVAKPKENKSSADANSAAQKKSGRKQGIGFVDNRPEAIAQRKLQEMANNSYQVKQLKAFQEMINDEPKRNKLDIEHKKSDNLPQGPITSFSHSNSVIQRRVPRELGEDPKPLAILAQDYRPQGVNTPIGRTMNRPSWQSGYRSAWLKKVYGTDEPQTVVTDALGRSVPIWSIEMDHIIPWSVFRDVMIQDGRYTVAQAKLYYHDIENIQPLNSYENRRKSALESPDYEVPESDRTFGILPREAVQAVTDLVFDINNVSQAQQLNPVQIQIIGKTLSGVRDSIKLLRSQLYY